jgi:ADP-ribose pyrophosphatase
VAVTDPQWARRGSRYLFQSKWYALRQDELTLPDGREFTYTLVEHPGFVMVVPLLADGRVVMERLYRYTLQRVTLECPSGGCDGDTFEAAARRELEEETGYRAGRLQHLGTYAASGGISDEQFAVYLATELHAGVMQREPTEHMELEVWSLGELRRMALRGELADAPTSLAILLAAEALGAGAPR